MIKSVHNHHQSLIISWWSSLWDREIMIEKWIDLVQWRNALVLPPLVGWLDSPQSWAVSWLVWLVRLCGTPLLTGSRSRQRIEEEEDKEFYEVQYVMFLLTLSSILVKKGINEISLTVVPTYDKLHHYIALSIISLLHTFSSTLLHKVDIIDLLSFVSVSNHNPCSYHWVRSVQQ